MNTMSAFDNERLIQCVKKHPCLYDPQDREYKTYNVKAAIWEAIGQEFNESSETVKLKWKTMRDSYIKYKKSVRLSANTGKQIWHYIWAPHLKFLDHYSSNRKRKHMSDSQSNPSDYQYQHHFATVVPSMHGNSEATISALTNESLGDVLSGMKSKSNYDATDHLFLSYAETFKKFSVKQQALLKIELAKLFANAEIAELGNDNGEGSASNFNMFIEADPTCEKIMKVESSASSSTEL